jgi:unsaturated rhamnogalacturonyl hydrolase
MSYFNELDNIYNKSQGRPDRTLQVIADRYIGEHPKHDPVFRAFRKDGFLRNGDYQYVFDFREKFPNIQDGQFVYAWAKLWSDQPAEYRFGVNCFGPIRIFINNGQVHKSNLNDDVFPDVKKGFSAKLDAGWNHVVIEFLKTGTGCGGRFGTGSVKGMPLHFLTPSRDRSGQEGWLYSVPLQAPLSTLPSEGQTESDTGVTWLPRMTWDPALQATGQFARIFGARHGRIAYAWTKLNSRVHGVRPFDWKGSHEGDVAIFLDGKLVYSAKGSGSFHISVRLSYGDHDLVMQSQCTGESWGFTIEEFEPGLRCTPPRIVHGTDEMWFYVGTFHPSEAQDVELLCRMDTLHVNGVGGTYWHLDAPNTVVRPYMENKLFGKWNYPLGVTLYGLLQTGIEVGRNDYVHYVLDHIELSTSYDRYALWDKEQYGAAGINHQLSAIDSLDDCGSFAATMLVAMIHKELKGGRAVADRVADYISRVQDRLPDGALFRVRGSTEFMKDTIWCDDLYMSTPFLCRYYQLSGDQAYVNDAANQFLLYKKYLFMPELKIMSHVYDFKFNKQTGIPWGRGFGWVLFSLTELLAVLPDDHERKGELLAFFGELCEGCLRLQGKNGLWHQVLNVLDSYEETSCTSMFIYAFSRGVRFGWISDPEPYVESVMKAWEGMTRISIDKYGNVYGVCRGSGYSYSPLYYKDELSWNLNDTHGIGIVMLAGIEVMKMQSHLQSEEAKQPS